MVPTIPLPKIIHMTFILNFRNRKRPILNKANSTIRKSSNFIFFILELNIAKIRIDRPADAIMDTTAGRNPDNTPWIAVKFLNLI